MHSENKKERYAALDDDILDGIDKGSLNGIKGEGNIKEYYWDWGYTKIQAWPYGAGNCPRCSSIELGDKINPNSILEAAEAIQRHRNQMKGKHE